MVTVCCKPCLSLLFEVRRNKINRSTNQRTSALYNERRSGVLSWSLDCLGNRRKLSEAAKHDSVIHERMAVNDTILVTALVPPFHNKKSFCCRKE
eukprot:scaffold8332_cov172-Amphora_coffeaeformis.AAC.9